MDYTYYLNPDFKLVDSIESKESNDFIYLQNISDNSTIRLSKIEYELINEIIYTKDIGKVIKKFSSEGWNISFDDIHGLVTKSESLGYISKNRKDFYSKNSKIKLLLDYISILFNKYLNLEIFFPLMGDTRFFTLMLLKLPFLSRLNKSFLIFLKLFIFILFLISLFSFSFFDFTDFFNSNFSEWRTSSLFFLLLLILFYSILHEFSHFIFYKSFGGKFNLFGIALSNMILPVFFVRVSDTIEWNSKKEKLLVDIAGVFMDVILLSSFYFIIKYVDIPNSLGLSLHVFYVYLIFTCFTNLNFLLPSTDGYFIFQNLLNIEELYRKSYNSFKEIIREGNINKINIFYSLYFILANIMITIYWFSIVGFFIFPFVARFFL